ncbi:peptidase inhibitor family I36 protein [Streptomyces ficellus]|uniref:Peptidase inhibitor family I36 protein n=1 Tax=Streptomyces ficellus TaxID=1977088 RepID=A0ABT7Z1F8_9ACTN|nr:peptidase inhibitor family I36 protein [Streptomyces ficellus]MDN3293315.1 peptidase inhibitor family I36 protein [Streptomyces ficellus]
MSANRGKFVLAAALAAATLGLAPAVAHAQDAVPAGAAKAGTASARTAAVAAADGNLYAWEHSWKGGRVAAWSGNSSNWADRNMRNQASSVHNNGYPGAYDDVRLYWDANYGGASYCLPNGSYLMDMRYDYFPHNGAGGGQAMNDNISSHRWVNSC